MVAALPGRRLRHFQKQGPVEEELKKSWGQVQVELKLRSLQPLKCGRFGSPHWKYCSRSWGSAKVALKSRRSSVQLAVQNAPDSSLIGGMCDAGDVGQGMMLDSGGFVEDLFAEGCNETCVWA